VRSALILVIVLGGSSCLASEPNETTMPASSQNRLLLQQLPQFRRRALAGAPFDSEEAAGKVVVVKFFAKYCAPCQRTLPEAQRLHRRWRDVAVVGIALDEDPGAVWQQVRRYQLTFPVVHDRGLVLAGRFRVTQMPIAFVADRSGRIVWVGGPDKTGGELWQAVRAARSGGHDVQAYAN
jgi:thiol-disulfide isomerase/thioredoxin